MSPSGERIEPKNRQNGEDPTSELVSQVISNWRNGAAPDALKFLAEHPGLVGQKSLVLDLAYEEYCLRKEKGESVTADDFCEKFPDWQRSLTRLIDVHEYLDRHPEFTPIEEQARWPQVGDVLFGFEIERKLGSGAFARVYVARDPSLGYRPVALKVSRGGASEAMTLGRLIHDNIVPVSSVQDDAVTGLTAICMPYQGESTLVDLLDAGFKSGGRPQTGDVILAVARNGLMREVEQAAGPNVSRLRRQSYVDAIVGLAMQLAGALKYAHSRGVLHRDLKPSNVLLAPDGAPKLLDFNLSLDSELSGARLGGTVPYMSPEQVRSVLLRAATDRRDAVDQRSDLYSLGVVMYELLTGSTPFGALGAPGNELKDAEELLNRQRRGARPVEELNPDVGPSLSRIVAWCLEYDSADRPQTAADLESALASYQRPASRIMRQLRHRRRLVTTVVAAAVMLLAAFGIWLASRQPFPVRAYQAGMASYTAGDWGDAAQWFSEAMTADRPTAELLYARAMARIRSGDFHLAGADLDLARRMSTSGALRANLAYCRTIGGDYSAADYWYREAKLKQFANAAVHNNLGFCKLQLYKLSPRIQKVVEAKDELDLAIEQDSNLACAYQNRAMARLELHAAGRHELPSAVNDIERALESAPDNWSIHRDAAIVFAHSSIEKHEHRRRVAECLERVVALGGSLKDVRKAKCFDHLRVDSDVARRWTRPTLAM